MADQQQYQIKLSDGESRRLAVRVMTDYRAALGDHGKRMNKWREYFRRWRCLVDTPRVGEDDKSNYPVPVSRWLASQKWARNADSIFGDDAEIVAVPTGPSDFRNDKKIGTYMTWRVFQDMKMTNRLLQFELYSIIFGRSVAYLPWCKKAFDFQTSKGTETNVYYDGPDFVVLEGDDFIVPAEPAETLHDFSWMIRKVQVTPQQLLDGEAAGRYTGITENFDKILIASYKRTQRDAEGDQIKREKDTAEGIQVEGAQSSGNTLQMLEWYGRWRMIKRGLSADTDEWDIKRRQLNESDIVVRILPEMGDMLVGAQDLRKLYPADPHPRPFVERSFQKDGSYWCDGMIAMSIDTEDEIRANHNKGTDAQDLVVAPPILYKPAQGFEPKAFRVRPGMMIPSDNPDRDIKQMQFTADLEAVAAMEQVLLAYLERLTGETDQANGRASDRPNAPRTAAGQAMLMQAANLRMTLDTTTLREDYALVFQKIWLLEFQFSNPEVFFRVTEEDANGLFPTAKGGALLKQADRNGRYDFRLKLATGVWDRAADKENDLARYQLDLQNPLIVQNPLALWEVTRRAHKALGDPNFEDLVPKPPTPDLPINPQREWAMMQQGETVLVNPMDNDELHMIRHMKDLQLALQEKYSDQDAIHYLKAHYIDHVHQLEQKKLVQALAQQAVQQASQLGINPAQMLGTGMGQLPPGIMAPPGGAPLPQDPVPMAGSAPPLIPKKQFAKAPPAPKGPQAPPVPVAA